MPTVESPAELRLPAIARQLGVEYRTLHSWAAAGLLRVPREGTGNPIPFQDADLTIAVVLAELRRFMERRALEGVSNTLYEVADRHAEWEVLVIANGVIEVGSRGLLNGVRGAIAAVVVDLALARSRACALHGRQP